MTARGFDRLAVYLGLGILFGLALTKGEAISWYRIQEMFRFQSFHMYGIMFSGLLTAMLLLAIVRRREMRSSVGDPVTLPPKLLGSGRRYWMGGFIFGIGWALAGACPGPFFALVGSGLGVMLLAILAALAGTWTYAHLREKLPH